MKSLLLATLSLAFAAPIDVTQTDTTPVASTPVTGNSGLTPLVSVGEDGSLWIGPDANERLLGTNVQELAQRHIGAKHGLQTTQHFCFGGNRHHHEHFEPLREPCYEPCFEPPPPRAPCEPCVPVHEPCDPCRPYDASCCDDPCRDELKASCYTKWFCPSTYCCDGDGICPEEPYYGNPCYSKHPVVDGLRRSCLTKWFCPSTYCPSNWCCDESGCLDASCWGGACCEPEFEYDCEPGWEEPPFEPFHEPCCI